MAEIQKAILKAFKMVKTNGVVVVNAMHLTQILSMLNELNKNKIDYSIELVIEPSNRLWELRKIKSHNKFKESNNLQKEFQKLIVNKKEIRFHSELPVFILPEEMDENYFSNNNIIISSFGYPDPSGKKINRAVLNALHTQEDLLEFVNVL